jgi:Holliday junction resolvasome RuvABC endonuclease subunit
MKILGVDSSMRNTGWKVLEIDQEWEDPTSIVPIEKYKCTDTSTHEEFKMLGGGNIAQPKKESIVDRAEGFLNTYDRLQKIIDTYNPDIMVIEGTIDYGEHRSVTGVSLFYSIIKDFLPSDRSDSYRPRMLITITPERLNSIAFRKRTFTDSETKKLYKEQTKDLSRVTPHEADAYYLAYFGARFYLTNFHKRWDRSIYYTKEKQFFLQSMKNIFSRKTKTKPRALIGKKNISMLNSNGESWWFLKKDLNVRVSNLVKDVFSH